MYEKEIELFFLCRVDLYCWLSGVSPMHVLIWMQIHEFCCACWKTPLEEYLISLYIYSYFILVKAGTLPQLYVDSLVKLMGDKSTVLIRGVQNIFHT